MTDKTDSKERDSIISSSDILLHDAQTALMYEELRAAIDDGHESMTHADALAEIAAIRAENEQLQAQLASIGAGGVSGPLMGQPQEMPDLSALTERGAKAWAGVDARELREGFTAADMATASAQGFRDGVASLAASAGSEPVAKNRPSLEAVFRGLSDRAYCNYIEQMRRDVCLGWEHKAAHGRFGEAELKGHTRAGEMLGRHKAFAEAANALLGSDAPLTHPSPPEGRVMVPKEPTEAMLEAVDEEVGGHCYSCSKWRASYDDCRRIWAAMIAAAPPTSSADSRKGE
ncbi:hypothetical protein DBR23_05890 [Acidovorax sp. HMWF018]|uniref:hypothetical protein n=1 Tax=Acidovorax sp. HMWF018 TaxID=2056855 RepID=UPI000D3A9A5C|nr:hypothetical protein [Acidovorax sp. HMWF018]PTT41477.1 hypothetical protein DBR23_05890 [Acidovorax sp. HMWF018]